MWWYESTLSLWPQKAAIFILIKYYLRKSQGGDMSQP